MEKRAGIIRKATPQDAPALEELMYALLSVHTPLGKMANAIEQMAQDERVFLAVYCQNDRPVGTVTGILCPDYSAKCQPFLVIENVAVLPELQGQGIGKKLMHAVEDWAKEQGAIYGILVSSAHRTDAHAFYRNLGYSTEGGFRKMFGSFS